MEKTRREAVRKMGRRRRIVSVPNVDGSRRQRFSATLLRLRSRKYESSHYLVECPVAPSEGSRLRFRFRLRWILLGYAGAVGAVDGSEKDEGGSEVGIFFGEVREGKGASSGGNEFERVTLPHLLRLPAWSCVSDITFLVHRHLRLHSA